VNYFGFWITRLEQRTRIAQRDLFAAGVCERITIGEMRGNRELNLSPRRLELSNPRQLPTPVAPGRHTSSLKTAPPARPAGAW
jgi:hypothetical protein